MKQRPPGLGLLILLALAVGSGLTARVVYGWIGVAGAAAHAPEESRDVSLGTTRGDR